MEDTPISNIMNTVTETHDQVMKLTVTVNSLIARLEAFEKMYSCNNVAPKRSIKVAPVTTTSSVQEADEVASVSSSIGSKSKTGVVKPAPSKSGEKIVNALTFYKKYIMYKNYNNLREKYSTPEMIEVAKVGVKKPEGTEAYWISIGNTIWKKLDKKQRDEVKEEYAKWKKINQINVDNSQLNEDDECDE